MIRKSMFKSLTSVAPVLIIVSLALMTSACKVLGPDYTRPIIDVPETYKEATGLDASKTRAALVDTRWWTLYNDDELNLLADQIEVQNYSVQALEARVRQAQALTEIAEAAKSPRIIAGGTNDLGIIANWEVDLWGRIKRSIEASGASTQASQADLAGMKLSMQAQLVQNYLLLRVQDTEIRLLQDTVSSYERSLKISKNQYAVGVASRGDLMQAQTQLSAAQAQMHDSRVTRSQLEHAIAVLIGKSPADYSIAAATSNVSIPEIPSTLPAELLVRRPDIVAAERRVASASAQIGVAEASAYPSLALFAGVTIRKGIVGGTQLAAPIYSKQTPKAGQDKAVAAYDEAVADYRQTVISGFREVEDSLASLQILEEASNAQTEAAKAGREAEVITNNQFRVGVASQQTVIAVQAAALATERTALGLQSRRYVASVALIKALGGGWDSSVLENNIDEVQEKSAEH